MGAGFNGLADMPPRQTKATGDIILLIHGIRDQATWGPMVANVLKAEVPDIIEVFPIKYGWFDSLRFWLPFWTREAPVDRVLREIEIVQQQYPKARISIIAHSFGTYIVSRILRDHPSVRYHRLILCGSIIDTAYRWDLVSDRLSTRVINDYGSRDSWPIMAKTLTWGFGDSGSNGFGTVHVRDRAHDFGHGGFFREEFVREYWAPWFRENRVTPSPWDGNVPPRSWLLNVWSSIPVQWIGLVLTVMLMLAGLLQLYRIQVAATKKRADEEYIRVHAVDANAGGILIQRNFTVDLKTTDESTGKNSERVGPGQELQITRANLRRITNAECTGYQPLSFSGAIVSDTSKDFPLRFFRTLTDKDDNYFTTIQPSQRAFESHVSCYPVSESEVKKNIHPSEKVNLYIHNDTSKPIDVLMAAVPTPNFRPIDANTVDVLSVASIAAWERPPGPGDAIAPKSSSENRYGFQVQDCCFVFAVSVSAQPAEILAGTHAIYLAPRVRATITERDGRFVVSVSPVEH